MNPDGLDRDLSRGADVGVDPFFTARVLGALPDQPVGATLLPSRRLAVLVAAYAGAALLGYAALGDEQSATMAGATAALSSLVERADDESLPWAGAVALPLGLLAVAFLAARPHTERA